MLVSSRLRRILTLGLPIIGGMVSQNILNLVDTAMVGTLGDAALAAVGIGGFTLFMCQALILGISTGVQATAARRKGEGDESKAAAVLNTALALVLMIGPVFSLVLFWVIPHLFPLINNDPEVMAAGIPYLGWRIMAITFVGMNFAFRGYWNAMDQSSLYMLTLIVMHACNIFFNWVFIFGNLGAPALGAEGAGLSSAIAMVIGTAVYFYLGFRFRPAQRISGRSSESQGCEDAGSPLYSDRYPAAVLLDRIRCHLLDHWQDRNGRSCRRQRSDQCDAGGIAAGACAGHGIGDTGWPGAWGDAMSKTPIAGAGMWSKSPSSSWVGLACRCGSRPI